MSARSSISGMLGRTLAAFGALFLVTLLLAAKPGHRPPAEGAVDAQPGGPPAQEMSGMDHGQNADDGVAGASEKAAVSEMAHMQGDGPHLHMTGMRPKNAE